MHDKGKPKIVPIIIIINIISVFLCVRYFAKNIRYFVPLKKKKKHFTDEKTKICEIR